MRSYVVPALFCLTLAFLYALAHCTGPSLVYGSEQQTTPNRTEEPTGTTSEMPNARLFHLIVSACSDEAVWQDNYAARRPGDQPLDSPLEVYITRMQTCLRSNITGGHLAIEKHEVKTDESGIPVP